MTVPHTVTFEATIDLDKIPSKLLPALLALSETAVLQIANENNTWAEVSIKEGN